MDNKTFLGTGWGFPPTFNQTSGTVEVVANAQDVIESLQILFSTRIDERIMRPEFGCDLTPLLYENISETLLTKMKDIIRTAILKYEPRIDLNDIVFSSDDNNAGVINILIEFTIKTTNSRLNYVFPFYLNEGTYLK